MISPEQYQFVADQINELQLIEETSINFIDLLNDEIGDLSSLNEPVNYIKTTIGSVNAVLNTRFIEDNSISNFVRSLQLHVLNNTIYTDINDYLSDFEIKVNSLFADVSERVDYLINPSNIN